MLLGVGVGPHANCVTFVEAGFLHHDPVCASRQRCPRQDPDGLTCLDHAFEGVTSSGLAGQPQCHGPIRNKIFGADRIAIHGGIVVRGQIHIGYQVCRQDGPVRASQRDRLLLKNRRQLSADGIAGVGKRHRSRMLFVSHGQNPSVRLLPTM